MKAAGLADELRGVLNIEARLIPGADGIFDVTVDGQRVFSRSEAGLFPEAGGTTPKLRVKK